MRTAFRILVVVALLAVELYAAYAVLHPRVNPEYRAFFIDHSTVEWEPKHYNATPEDGISFATPGWPNFVRYALGFSFQEPGGRWTDAAVWPSAQILTNRNFSGPLCIQFVGRPAYSQQGKQLEVALGNNVGYVTPSDLNPATYHVSFANAQPADTLDFRFNRTIPSNKEFTHNGNDGRRLGFLLIQLKILPSECKTAS